MKDSTKEFESESGIDLTKPKPRFGKESRVREIWINTLVSTPSTKITHEIPTQ